MRSHPSTALPSPGRSGSANAHRSRYGYVSGCQEPVQACPQHPRVLSPGPQGPGLIATLLWLCPWKVQVPLPTSSEPWLLVSLDPHSPSPDILCILSSSHCQKASPLHTSHGSIDVHMPRLRGSPMTGLPPSCSTLRVVLNPTLHQLFLPTYASFPVPAHPLFPARTSLPTIGQVTPWYVRAVPRC